MKAHCKRDVAREVQAYRAGSVTYRYLNTEILVSLQATKANRHYSIGFFNLGL